MKKYSNMGIQTTCASYGHPKHRLINLVEVMIISKGGKLLNTFHRMNAVIDFIEANLIGEIDYKQAAQIAACPINQFQRFFAYITNITLSDYIRRRRLTLCAFELQENKDKVIDIAIKYGYSSPSSFSRAFRYFH